MAALSSGRPGVSQCRPRAAHPGAAVPAAVTRTTALQGLRSWDVSLPLSEHRLPRTLVFAFEVRPGGDGTAASSI